MIYDIVSAIDASASEMPYIVKATIVSVCTILLYHPRQKNVARRVPPEPESSAARKYEATSRVQ
jgi:hypothetical protein